MGDLLYVNLLTEFTPYEIEAELEQTRNAFLLHIEEMPQPCPDHLLHLYSLFGDEEEIYCLHALIRTDRPVEGPGPLAYWLDARRLLEVEKQARLN